MLGNLHIDLLCWTVTVCFAIDVSGFTNFVRKFVASRLEGKYHNLKAEDVKIPFLTCSLCTVWWSGIIILLYHRSLTFPNLAYVAALSLLSSNVSGILLLVKDVFSWAETKIVGLLRKL